VVRLVRILRHAGVAFELAAGDQSDRDPGFFCFAAGEWNKQASRRAISFENKKFGLAKWQNQPR
jgi:hypothetical protein